jgi:integrase/recombinase XerD
VRTLRKILNNAIDDEILSKKKYPFGRNKYIIPSGRNTKKAIDSSWLPAIYNYQPNHKSEWFARDTWFFLYFGNGMNPKDMASLKYKNIVRDYISFDRAKTITTAKEDAKSITVFLSKELAAIIDRWGNQKIDDDTYIFPILSQAMNPLQEMFAIQNFVRNTNDWMSRIFEALGFDSRSSTIVARHSYSTHMLYAGASKELIQESLGHQSMKTTENYLASFEKKVVKEFANKLAAFTDAESSIKCLEDVTDS